MTPTEIEAKIKEEIKQDKIKELNDKKKKALSEHKIIKK